MTRTYAQIQKEIESLQRAADKLKRQEVEGVIARIKEAISAYGLNAADLGLGAASGRTRRAAPVKAARSGRRRKAKYTATVKYRDDAGNTWVGRGPRPQWLRDALDSGKSLQDFAV
jgi:DNA-binding protein H-NS